MNDRQPLALSNGALTGKRNAMTNETDMPRGSTASQPDPIWSQVRETVLMLELAAVQIESAMKDSNASVEVLAHSFATMADYMQTISDTLQTLPNEGEAGIAKQKLAGVSGHVSSMMHQAIVGFQFYDKLVQRLSHVGLSLGDLSNLLGDKHRLFSPDEWVDLRQKIRAKYTTREEIAMFEAVMQGMAAQAAIDRFRADMKNQGNEIELF